jgi:hypothetical protein
MVVGIAANPSQDMIIINFKQEEVAVLKIRFESQKLLFKII